MTVRAEVIRLLDEITVLGKRNYADDRPEGEALPHTVVLDGISQTPEHEGDARALAWRHLLQVDLWEDAQVASEVTRDAVINALDGAVITGAFRLRVGNADRIYDPDRRLAHTAITLRTVRLR
jgi:hypothetical protein